MYLRNSIQIFIRLLSLVFFITGLFFFVTFKNDKSESLDALKQSKKLENSIQFFTTNAVLDSAKLASLVSKDWYKTEFSTPFIVFKNNKPFFWSRNNLFSTFSADFKSNKFGIINFPNGNYFYVVKQLNGFQVVHYLLIKNNLPFENEFLKEVYNVTLFNSRVNFDLFYSEENDSNPIMYNSKPVFWIRISSNARVYDYSILFFTLSIIMFGFVVFSFSEKLKKHKKSIFSFFTLVTYFCILRLFFHFTNGLSYILPDKLFEFELFASSFFAHTFAYLLLDSVLLFLTFLYINRLWFSGKNISWITKLSDELYFILLFFFSLISFFYIDFFIVILNDIYQNSTLNFDITRSIQLDLIEFVYLLIFVFLSIIYLLISRFFLKTFDLFSTSSKTYYLVVSFAALFFSIIQFYFSSLNSLVVFIHFFYLSLCWSFTLFKRLKKFRFNSYLYLILSALVCSIIGSNSIHNHSKEIDKIHQIQIAEELLVHDDFQAELLLKRLSDKIKFDFTHDEYLNFNFIDVDHFKENLSANYISHYFDNYRINIHLFDLNGAKLDSNLDSLNLSYYSEKYQKQGFRTEYNDVFFVNFYDHSDYSKYLCFVTLDSVKFGVKTIVMELTSDGINPNSVYPKLLKAKEIQIPEKHQVYQCAVFENKKLIYSSGTYNFKYENFKNVIEKSQEFYMLYFKDGYRHLIYKGIDDKVSIVSLKSENIYRILTNISFLLLILLFLFLISFLLFLAFNNWINVHPHYSTRIHLYLNFVYLLAIISVSIVTLNWVVKEYDYELKSSFQQNAFHVGKNVSKYLEDYQSGKLNNQEFQNAINTIVDYNGTDLNLYDSSGHLFFTSQPLIFKNGLVTKLLDPKVMKELNFLRHNSYSQDEHIGEFKYHNVYLTLTSYNDDHNLAILSMPFLDSQEALETRKVALVNVILNVFTVVFILVLIISYASFINLSSPLKKLTASISSTSLDENLKIDWRADDEIGMLVRAYNNMIAKLEISKIQLAERQKEDAWKEMAKQVAHEIKNPLTPMQLKLQHMKRLFPNNEAVQSSIDALLEQVYTLSEIATSFSNFAKMPAPEYERLNITKLVKEACSFFENESVDIIQNLKNIEIFVVADTKLLSRVFNNLIINAIQSVNTNFKPLIIITVDVTNTFVLISIQDNGEGIPEDIKEKVFQPNFSTKFNGSGIGLAVAKRGIEHGGGKIWFESEQGKGTTFYIEIPLAS